ncbi:MAG: hypothetical protein AAGM46_26490 [Cyanobacteria bacterium J06582_2]
MNDVAEFFVHLRQVKKLSVPTIEGYRSAIASVQPGVGTDQTVSDLLKAFSQEAPVSDRKIISWNLDVVLVFLRGPQFEPIGQSSLRSLTMKTLFLVALATARRMSELQALSMKVGFRDDGAQLSYLLSFVAKNETRAHPIPRVFQVKGLAHLVADSPGDFVNCPVRALREYCRRVKSLRAGHVNLFCAVRNPARPMSKNGISFFLREVILKAHESCPVDSMPLCRVKAYDVRSVATSFAFLRNVPLQDIIDSVAWKTQSVFACNYLKDISFLYGDGHSLGPVVSAGFVVP